MTSPGLPCSKLTTDVMVRKQNHSYQGQKKNNCIVWEMSRNAVGLPDGFKKGGKRETWVYTTECRLDVSQ